MHLARRGAGTDPAAGRHAQCTLSLLFAGALHIDLSWLAVGGLACGPEGAKV